MLEEDGAIGAGIEFDSTLRDCSNDKGILKEFPNSKRPGCILPHAWLLV
jgi:hypothetical protein